MRRPLVYLAGFLLAVGCTPLPNVVYVPTPAPAPAADAEVVEMPPVGVTILRADEGRVLLSTNQPAYVAVFELLPNRGVSLVYPTSYAQRQATITGSSWLTLADNDAHYGRELRDERYGREVRASSVRYLYAVASERPLRLSYADFDDDHLRAVLSMRTYRVIDPYETIEALSWRYLPAELEQDWGEDLYTMDVARRGPVVRIAKVYCPDGSVTYVREDLAERSSCPRRMPRAGGHDGPWRPDSVVTSDGHAIARHGTDARLRPPVFRVPRPTEVGVLQQGGSEPPTSGRGPGTVGGVGAHIDSTSHGHEDHDGHHDNGNHYGWDRGNRGSGNGGNNGNGPGNNGGNGSGNSGGNSGSGMNGGNSGNGRNGNAGNGDNGNHHGWGNGNNGNHATADTANAGQHGTGHAASPSSPRRPESEPSRVQPMPAVPAAPSAEPAGGRPVMGRVRERQQAAAQAPVTTPAAPAATAPAEKKADEPAARRPFSPRVRADVAADTTKKPAPAPR